MLQCVAVCCSVLHVCGAECYSVLQCDQSEESSFKVLRGKFSALVHTSDDGFDKKGVEPVCGWCIRKGNEKKRVINP